MSVSVFSVWGWITFVKDHHLRLAKQRPRECDELHLSARKLGSGGTNGRQHQPSSPRRKTRMNKTYPDFNLACNKSLPSPKRLKATSTRAFLTASMMS